MRVCVACGECKPLTAEFFSPHPSSVGGFRVKCRPCRAAQQRAYYRATLEARRAFERRPERVASRHRRDGEQLRRYRQRHPDRDRAHERLNDAVRRGRVRPQPCRVCGAKAEAHHPDYSRPYDVDWLCRRHHRAAEGRLVEAEA